MSSRLVPVKVLVGCAAVLLVAGCDQQGFQLGTAGGGPFNVVSVNHERAVVSVAGRQVAIEAAEGFCLAKESIETSGRSAFAMIGDCVLDDPQATRQAAAKSLPQGVPGFITVSISGNLGFSGFGQGAASLEELSEYLKTSEGRAMLGRGGSGSSVKIRESRTVGDGLFVLVEDEDTAVVPILAPKFWRSFIELNERLAVVTISSFRDKPLDDDEMLKYLVNQVKTLTVANRVPLNEDRTMIAEAARDPAVTSENVQTLADLNPEPLVASAETVRGDVSWPVPRKRDPARETAEDDAAPTDDRAIDAETDAASQSVPVPETRPEPATDDPAITDATVTDGGVAQAPAEVADAGTPEDETPVLLVNPQEQDEDPASTPTAFAPQTAPEAPRRPRRG